MNTNVTVNDIKWGKYGGFEGPYFMGRWRYVLPSQPAWQHRVLSVITSTEGGTYDAINAYDSCIMTVGLVQWCDRYHLVTRLLGYIADNGGVSLVTGPLTDALRMSGATFRKNRNGQWRFFLGSQELSTEANLRKLYLGGSTGKIGEWTPYQKTCATMWVVGMANIWNSDRARELQVIYTADRIQTFALKDSKHIVLETNPEWSGLVGATKAIFLSYCASNPKTADTLTNEFASVTDAEAWSDDWCRGLIHKLATGSNIEIWPERYVKVAAAANRAFSTDLPETPDKLIEAVTLPDIALPKEPVVEIPQEPVTPIERVEPIIPSLPPSPEDVERISQIVPQPQLPTFVVRDNAWSYAFTGIMWFISLLMKFMVPRK